MEDYLHNDVASEIIIAFYSVINKFGNGKELTEYAELIKTELINRELEVKNLSKTCKENMIICEKVFIKISVNEDLSNEDEIQFFRELKTIGVSVGLLLNFASVPEVKRKVYVK